MPEEIYTWHGNRPVDARAAPELSVREINAALRALPDGARGPHHRAARPAQPRRRPDQPAATSRSRATPGYFIGGLCDGPDITVDGFVGWSVGENLMSGTIRVRGNASECAGASGARRPDRDRGRRLVPGRDLAQGRHDRGRRRRRAHERVHGPGRAPSSSAATPADALGDSLYEAVIYVGGQDRRRSAPTPGSRSSTDADVRRGARSWPTRRASTTSSRERDQGRLRPRAVQLRRAEGPEVLMDDAQPAASCRGRAPSAATSSRPRSSRQIQSMAEARPLRDPRLGRQAAAADVR